MEYKKNMSKKMEMNYKSKNGIYKMFNKGREALNNYVNKTPLVGELLTTPINSRKGLVALLASSILYSTGCAKYDVIKNNTKYMGKKVYVAAETTKEIAGKRFSNYNEAIDYLNNKECKVLFYKKLESGIKIFTSAGITYLFMNGILKGGSGGGSGSTSGTGGGTANQGIGVNTISTEFGTSALK